MVVPIKYSSDNGSILDFMNTVRYTIRFVSKLTNLFPIIVDFSLNQLCDGEIQTFRILYLFIIYICLATHALKVGLGMPKYMTQIKRLIGSGSETSERCKVGGSR